MQIITAENLLWENDDYNPLPSCIIEPALKAFGETLTNDHVHLVPDAYVSRVSHEHINLRKIFVKTGQRGTHILSQDTLLRLPRVNVFKHCKFTHR
ncbi:hypothetical protein Y032_0070g497 [Ancylostoma ceylanicum]|uniref:Uncharacterized protein n=1 Tax=Ancylostoma ceylanicum TaxID=53326 RepID=A0A016TXP0_9BILA|nr:hypothetical protein Y032_0070g497 [Ancylostoma ceylanicum]